MPDLFLILAAIWVIFWSVDFILYAMLPPSFKQKFNFYVRVCTPASGYYLYYKYKKEQKKCC